MSKTATEKWVDEIWSLAGKNARDVTGDRVIALLREASVEVWDAGFDLRFADRRESLTLERAHVFDITWLSVFVAKLAQAPRVRR